MTDRNSVVAIYDTHEQAEQAVKSLQEAGVDMKSLSIAGKDHVAAGMAMSADARERLDYIGIELEFLRLLALRELEAC